MTDIEQKIQIVTLATSLFERGYSVGGAGNLSVRLDSNRLLVTPTGSSLGRLEADKLSLLDMQGNLLSGSNPSKEAGFHIEMYKANPECKAIVHLHSTYLTALSCIDDIDTENALKPFTPYYVMRINKLPVIPYYKPGDPNIGIELAKRALSSNAFLLANHGVVVTGSSLIDAVNNTEELEETAKLYFILNGQKIRYLTSIEVEELKNRGK